MVIAVITARPAKRRSVSDSDVIVAGAAFILPLELVFACFATIGQSFGQERLEGRSSHNGEILRDVSFPLSWNQGYDSNRSVLWRLVEYCNKTLAQVVKLCGRTSVPSLEVLSSSVHPVRPKQQVFLCPYNKVTKL